MKECAVLLEKAVHENKADPKQLAYLTDRIAVLEGRPQFYGTNFDWDEKGELSPRPVYGINKVDQRRKSIGLNSLEEQTKIIRQQAIEEGQEPPADINERKTIQRLEKKCRLDNIKPLKQLLNFQLLTDNLKKLNLPLLITYGGKDHSAPFDDYLRVEMIRQRKRNFSFRSCSGLEHNYFRLNPDGQPDYNNVSYRGN